MELSSRNIKLLLLCLHYLIYLLFKFVESILTHIDIYRVDHVFKVVLPRRLQLWFSLQPLSALCTLELLSIIFLHLAFDPLLCAHLPVSELLLAPELLLDFFKWVVPVQEVATSEDCG